MCHTPKHTDTQRETNCCEEVSLYMFKSARRHMSARFSIFTKSLVVLHASSWWTQNSAKLDLVGIKMTRHVICLQGYTVIFLFSFTDIASFFDYWIYGVFQSTHSIPGTNLNTVRIVLKKRKIYKYVHIENKLRVAR